MVMVVNFGVLGNDNRTLHHTNGFVVVAWEWSEILKQKILSHSLMAYFHLRPLTPNFCKILNSPEIDFGGLLEDLSCTF